jgi:hypothetical protein
VVLATSDGVLLDQRIQVLVNSWLQSWSIAPLRAFTGIGPSEILGAKTSP